MTQRPNQTPTWAEVPTFGNPGAVEPNGAKKLNGFNFTEKPGAGVHNFLFQLLSRWLAYFIERVDGITFTFTTVNTGVAAGGFVSIAKLRAGGADEALLGHTSIGGKIRYSPDGISLVSRDLPSATANLQALACDNDGTRAARWMAGGFDGANAMIYRSSDRGQTWALVSPAGANGIFRIQHVSGGNWLAVGSISIVRTVNNGLDAWAAPVAGSLTVTDMHWDKVLGRGLTVRPGIFPITAVGLQSNNLGATWTTFTIPAGMNNIVDSFFGVMSDGVVWVLASTAGMFWTTDSNLNVWTACVMIGDGDFTQKPERIRYDADGGWIAFDGPFSGTAETTVWASRDGKTWTRKTRLLGSQQSLEARFVNGSWIIGRANGRLSIGIRMG